MPRLHSTCQSLAFFTWSCLVAVLASFVDVPVFAADDKRESKAAVPVEEPLRLRYIVHFANGMRRKIVSYEPDGDNYLVTIETGETDRYSKPSIARFTRLPTAEEEARLDAKRSRLWTHYKKITTTGGGGKPPTTTADKSSGTEQFEAVLLVADGDNFVMRVPNGVQSASLVGLIEEDQEIIRQILAEEASLRDPDTPRPQSEGPMLDDALAIAVRVAAMNCELAETEIVGGKYPSQIQSCPDGGVLIGFELCVADQLGAYKIIKWLSPIYLTARGERRVGAFGIKNANKFTIRAKPGYAVGGIRYRAGQAVDSIQPIFMRINGVRLDPNDSYESEAVGGSGGEPGILTGDGALVVGVRAGESFGGIGCLGLILMPQNPRAPRPE